MKQLLSLLLTLVMLLSLCACSNGDPATEPESTGAEQTVAAGETQETSGKTDVTVPSGDSTEPNEVTTEPSVDSTEPTQAHTHSYSGWAVTKNATCLATGVRSRSCACGDTQTEVIPLTDHSYVDDVCQTCGASRYSGTLHTLEDLEPDAVYYCSDDLIAYNIGDQYYIADRNGDLLKTYNWGIRAANEEGYVLAWNRTSEVIGTEVVDDDSEPYNITQEVFTYDVLDKTGSVVFTRTRTATHYFMNTSYQGECISSCNGDRIITTEQESVSWAVELSPFTVHIYDMSGKCLATWDDIYSVGTMIDGELAMITRHNSNWEMVVTDQNGRELRRGSCPIGFFPGSYWTTNGFIGGYAMLGDEGAAILVSSDLSKSFSVLSYLYDTSLEHYGSIVATKIDIDGTVSDKYYLVDLAKCPCDQSGFVTPTLDAAVCATGFDSIEIYCLYNTPDPYFLASLDGKWCYVTLDGTIAVTYDHASPFFQGIAIVKDGDSIYVIDESFNRLSNALTGFDTVSSVSHGVFRLYKDGKITIALYD